MRELVHTSQFKRDFKKLRLSDEDEARFLEVIDALIDEKPVAAPYRDHALTGNWVGCRECHLKPDLLLIYKLEENTVKLMRMGSHSNLFR